MGYNSEKLNGIVAHPVTGFTDKASGCLDFAHMCLQVKFPDGQRMLADVGFQQPSSRCSTLEPISLDRVGEVQKRAFPADAEGAEQYKIVPLDEPGTIEGSPGVEALVYIFGG